MKTKIMLILFSLLVPFGFVNLIVYKNDMLISLVIIFVGGISYGKLLYELKK